MGVKDHHRQAEEKQANCAILTISDTRTPDTDESGREARRILEARGHIALAHRIVPNDAQLIRDAIEALLRTDIDLVVTIGGTGISKKDLTVDVARSLIEKELVGFGELFRTLSYPEIGTGTIMSRAMLGATRAGKLIVCLPGSIAAVRVGLENILVKELSHLLWELRRYA